MRVKRSGGLCQLRRFESEVDCLLANRRLAEVQLSFPALSLALNTTFEVLDPRSVQGH